MPDLEPDDVAEALALDLPDDLDSAPLEIPDQRTANRALRRLSILDRDQAQVVADAEAELADLEQLIQPERDRIQAFVEDRVHGIQRARDWTLRGLEGWTRAVNALDPKLVTVKVSNGEIRLRKNPDRLAVFDTAAVAEALPSTVKPVEVQPAEVKKLVKPAGKGAPVTVELTGKVEVPEGYHPEAAVDGDGAVVPGVVFLVADGKRFEWDAS